MTSLYNNIALTFGVSPDSGNTRLLSLSQDRTLVCIDIYNTRQHIMNCVK